MKHFYLYIVILFCFIVLMSYYNTFEGFTSARMEKSYILLGDSIFKNDAYVSDGNSVEKLLAERNKNISCFAEDHSKIVDIHSQIDNIPQDLNSPYTFIFLSGGGNDILSHYVDQNQDITNTSILQPMFSAYKNLVKSIQIKLPKANLILLDIYYPDNLKYKQFHSIIKEWNNMIYEFSKNSKNNIYNVMRISEKLTKPEDFSFGIEPSTIGGKKIADIINNNYLNS